MIGLRTWLRREKMLAGELGEGSESEENAKLLTLLNSSAAL